MTPFRCSTISNKTCGKADARRAALQSKTYNLVITLAAGCRPLSSDSAQSTATSQALDTSQTVPVGGPISFRINENNDLTIDEKKSPCSSRPSRSRT